MGLNEDPVARGAMALLYCVSEYFLPPTMASTSPFRGSIMIAPGCGCLTPLSSKEVRFQLELNELAAEITRIGETTQFNTQKLLDGTFSGRVLQIGANKGETLSIEIGDMTATALNVNADNLSVETSEDAQDTIELVDQAINIVSGERAKLGAKQNRLEHTIKNLDTAAENLQASESRIRDVDMAQEMMNFTKNNILNQAAIAMLAQANQVPQGVLQLLG